MVFRVRPDLGGAGLGPGGDHAVPEIGGEGALYQALHALLHRPEVFVADVDFVDGLRVPHGYDLRIVIGLGGFQQMGLTVLPAGNQGGDIVGQLEGGVELVGLAETRPRGLVLALGVLRQESGGLGNLNARLFPQAELDQIFPKPLHFQAVAHFGEKVVAGVGDGPGDVQVPVARALPAVGVAVGLVPRIAPGAGVLDFLF